MKRLLPIIALLCVTGCASIYRGEGYVLSADDTEIGRHDDSYYIQSDAEFRRFNVWFKNRHSTLGYEKGKMDCDKWARLYVIEMIMKYNSYSWGGDAPAVQTNSDFQKEHMNVKVQTTTGIKIMEPQIGSYE